MSHTNSTTNYSLPQFIGTDKPAWLTDINSAFSAIDTAVKNASDAATTAGTNATTANTSIGTLSNLNTTEKTNLVGAVNEVNTNVNTVSGVASEASTTAGQAKTTADGIANYFKFTQFGDITASGTGVSISRSRMKYASNADGSFGKIYGDMNVTTTSASGGTVTFSTPFRPATAINIGGAFIQQFGDGTILKGDISVATDGTVTIERGAATYNNSYNFVFPACGLFFTDFGDTIQS